MQPETLAARIADGTAPAILDVRSTREYRGGHVPGAVHVPFWLVPFRVAGLPFGRDEPVVVYCGHGPRAWMAGAALRLHGFRKVQYLEGHWSGWQQRRLPGALP